MSRRYPPEVHEFIREHVEGLTCAELAKLTNEKVGTDFDEVRMHSYKCNHHLKSGTKAGKPKGWSPVYPEDMADYMRSIARGRRNERRRLQRPNGGAGAGQGRERREGEGKA